MSRLKSANRLKHVLILPEEKEKNSNRYNYDLTSYTQLTSTPDLSNYRDKTDYKKNKIKKSNSNRISDKNTERKSHENVETNLNSLCSSRNFISSTYVRINSARIKSGSKTRVLVQKENQTRVQNEFLLDPQTDNMNIQKNIIGSMHFYGNFINNPLTSNQYLINPNYNHNLFLMKSSKYYFPQINPENMELNENLALKKSYGIKIQEQQQHINKTETNTDFTSNSSNKLINGGVCTSSLKQPRPQSMKLSNKKVCFSDLNQQLEDKDKRISTIITQTNTEKNLISINRNNLITKNMFLNYKPKESEETLLNNILSSRADKNTIRRHFSNSETLLNRPKTTSSIK
jgi:hypothetical protein